MSYTMTGICMPENTHARMYTEVDVYIPPLFQLKSKFAVIVIKNDVSQFANVAMLPPRLLIFTGSI
jgi:hypothetical protein